MFLLQVHVLGGLERTSVSCQGLLKHKKCVFLDRWARLVWCLDLWEHHFLCVYLYIYIMYIYMCFKVNHPCSVQFLKKEEKIVNKMKLFHDIIHSRIIREVALWTSNQQSPSEALSSPASRVCIRPDLWRSCTLSVLLITKRNTTAPERHD